MEDPLIMKVYVNITGSHKLESPVGNVVMITFNGRIKSDLFNGRILPGGVDTQIIDLNKITHMSARYMAVGKDNEGQDCLLFIENKAFIPDGTTMPFYTIPTFYTDSEKLGAYLHQRKFRGEGVVEDDELVINMYEVAT